MRNKVRTVDLGFGGFWEGSRITQISIKLVKGDLSVVTCIADFRCRFSLVARSKHPLGLQKNSILTFLKKHSESLNATD